MSEVAVVSLNDAKIRKMAAEGHKKSGMLVKLLAKPTGFLSVIKTGLTSSGFFAAALAAGAFADYPVQAMSGMAVSDPTLRVVSIFVITLLISFLILVFGDMIPKRIAMHHYEAFSMAAARPLTIIAWIERPFVALISSVSGGILRLMGVPDQRPDVVTEEEIRMMIDVGNESGSIEESDKDMINNIFEFDDRTADEMMTHRTEIVAVDLDSPLDEIIQTVVESGYSRIPVCEGDLDSIVGILYAKDLLKLLGENPGDQFSLQSFMREPLYVLESTNCKMLMTEFKQKKIQMAVVVDEYGGTSGLITMEDLLEAIVGNIQDEYDEEEEEEISRISANDYLVDGLAGLEEVAKFFGFEPDEEEAGEFETIGGYVMHKLGYIPAESDRPSVVAGEILFTVEEMEERRIAKLRAKRVESAENTESE